MRLRRFGIFSATVLFLIASGAAQSAHRPQKYRNYSPPAHHSSAPSLNSKKASRSSVPAVAPTIGKSTSAQNSQLSQLEHQTATTIRADKKTSARSSDGHSQIAHSHPAEHGSSINFTYHPPQIPQSGQKNTPSASSGRRH